MIAMRLPKRTSLQIVRLLVLLLFFMTAMALGLGSLFPERAESVATRSCAPPKTGLKWASLRELPPIHRPAARSLLLGNRRFTLQSSPQVLKPGQAGFYLTLLNWPAEGEQAGLAIVSGTQISPRGKVRFRLPPRKYALHWKRLIAGDDLTLTTYLARPGYYRVDLLLRSRDGAKLQKVSEYFRVVEPTVSVALTLGGHVQLPGAIVSLRVENRGSIPITYGAGLRLERAVEGRWVFVPGTALTNPQYAVYLGIDSSGECETARLPSSLEAGKYRFSKEVTLPSGHGLTVFSHFVIRE